jgi:hypothetical protein
MQAGPSIATLLAAGSATVVRSPGGGCTLTFFTWAATRD